MATIVVVLKASRIPKQAVHDLQHCIEKMSS